MYNFLNDNSIYVVLLVALINWIGLFIYLVKTESKLNKLEKQISSMKTNNKGRNE
ncbi:MAG: CcmD family protein [Candidatus Kapaibacterium sp.]|nr:CcmD family protein [Ignavibacteriota bacterium]MCB9220683.1 CcmD family protein [Ignavibacteria bacterium]